MGAMVVGSSAPASYKLSVERSAIVMNYSTVEEEIEEIFSIFGYSRKDTSRNSDYYVVNISTSWILFYRLNISKQTFDSLRISLSTIFAEQYWRIPLMAHISSDISTKKRVESPT